MKGVDYA